MCDITTTAARGAVRTADTQRKRERNEEDTVDIVRSFHPFSLCTVLIISVPVYQFLTIPGAFLDFIAPQFY